MYCENCFKDNLNKNEMIEDSLGTLFCSEECFNYWKEDASIISVQPNLKKNDFLIPINDVSAFIDLYFGYALEGLWREEILPEDRFPEAAKLLTRKVERQLESLRVVLLEQLSLLPTLLEFNQVTHEHLITKRKTKAEIQKTQIRKDKRRKGKENG